MLEKKHLTVEGLREIVAIKASMNRGLPDKLKTAFSDITPTDGPLGGGRAVSDPYWLAGFTTAEGCFFVNIHKSPNSKLKERVRLVFQLTQHSRDEYLMKTLVDYFGCGVVSKQTDNAIVFRVIKLSDIENKIIPFFQKYPILGVKWLDYNDFCKVAELMKCKSHLTQDGLNEIWGIKKGMNTGREWS